MGWSLIAAIVGVVCVLAAIQETVKKDFIRGIVFGIVAFLCAAIYFGVNAPDRPKTPQDGKANQTP